ncbi:hypothetical protein AKJ39_00265 [candidate division MSBL1 archaeon SCGC-AAA259J03]|uniref:Xylose isomerase-like TIM barrel domain-containing protein n=1 Tax=candidate division MSBL1 archaeon SCGC-AAA259J03 TaxID=1698269 RepID=A0A656YXR4_9EURY|nr:hypothetical protein AKJ39_00265 [candidate division MSBL1 archaeon SCGC-AAA259J03]
MRIGFSSVCLSGMNFEELVNWASDNGFKALELEAYEGSDHCNVDDGLSDEEAERMNRIAEENDVIISNLQYAPNMLHPDDEKRKHNHDHLKKVIDACDKLDNCEAITTFIGRDPSRGIQENLEFMEEEYGHLVDYAKKKDVKLAIENCPMGFYFPDRFETGNIAYSPSIWERIFDVYGPTVGLAFDPSHLLWQGIDIRRSLREFMDRVYIVHGKDCMIDDENLARDGILNSEWVDALFVGKTGPGHRNIEWKSPVDQWWRYTIPGLGDIDFKGIFQEIEMQGYDFVVIIEHEDPVWYGNERLNKQGLKIGLKNLSQLLPQTGYGEIEKE